MKCPKSGLKIRMTNPILRQILKMTGQNYKNHGRLVFLYHGAAFLVILTALVLAVIQAAKHGINQASLLVLLITVALALLFVVCRTFPLKAQDRAIRAEEQLRHFVLTGKLFDSRLTIQQIIALRFASDAELPALAQKAAEEGLSPKTIKQSIQNWRGDYYRV